MKALCILYITVESTVILYITVESTVINTVILLKALLSISKFETRWCFRDRVELGVALPGAGVAREAEAVPGAKGAGGERARLRGMYGVAPALKPLFSL